MSIEKITSKIISEAQELRDKTLSEAAAQSDAVLAEARKKAEDMVEDSRKRGVEEKEKIISRRKSVADIDCRKVFLAKKQEVASKGESLKVTYEAAQANAQKMRQMHDKLVDDISTLNSRREAIKAKSAVAKTQAKVNQFSSASDKAEGAMAAFARMEAKADQMLDQANAEAELNAAGTTDRAADLAAQYAATGNSAAVDDELARLKADMGL